MTRLRSFICLLFIVATRCQATDEPEEKPEKSELPPQSDEEKALFDALKDEDVEAASQALKDGASINCKSPRGQQTPLMQSVLHGRIEMVKWCLENGADISIGEKQGYTPMHGAGFQGRAEIAAILKKHGAELRDVHEDGNEPIIRSCWGESGRHTETVAWFLDNGVPIMDIYESCFEKTPNERTKALLEARKLQASQKGEEL